MKKVLFGLIGISLLLSSCTEDEFAALGIIIEGTVTDRKTNEPLSGVAVEITTRDNTESVLTNESGFYSFPVLPAGYYLITFSSDGYLVRSSWAGSYDMAINSATEELIYNDQIQLSPLSESVSFTVFKYISGMSVAAVNAPYTVTFDERGNAPVSGTADEYGLVTISNLPYQSTCYIIFDFSENDIRYTYSSYYYSSNSQSNSIVIPGYFENGTLGVVSSNTLNFKGEPATDFKVDDPIEVTFTQPVDIASANINANFIIGSISWSEGNKKLTVTPESALNTGVFQYYLYVELYNETKSQYFINTFYFYTEE